MISFTYQGLAGEGGVDTNVLQQLTQLRYQYEKCIFIRLITRTFHLQYHYSNPSSLGNQCSAVGRLFSFSFVFSVYEVHNTKRHISHVCLAFVSELLDQLCREEVEK